MQNSIVYLSLFLLLQSCVNNPKNVEFFKKKHDQITDTWCMKLNVIKSGQSVTYQYKDKNGTGFILVTDFLKKKAHILRKDSIVMDLVYKSCKKFFFDKISEIKVIFNKAIEIEKLRFLLKYNKWIKHI